MAQSRPSMASGTLRWRNMALNGARDAPLSRPVMVTGSRMVNHIRTATTSPGAPTIMKTWRQSVTFSSWVARIGAMARPNRAKAHWNRPLFRPRRLGCEASTATATPVGATAPSDTPMMMRISNRLIRLLAMPVKKDSRENSTTAGARTLRRPRASDRPPTKIAETPQATPSAPTRLPRSCGVRCRSWPIPAANSGGKTHRSRPTRPKPTVSNSTALNS